MTYSQIRRPLRGLLVDRSAAGATLRPFCHGYAVIWPALCARPCARWDSQVLAGTRVADQTENPRREALWCFDHRGFKGVPAMTYSPTG